MQGATFPINSGGKKEVARGKNIMVAADWYPVMTAQSPQPPLQFADRAQRYAPALRHYFSRRVPASDVEDLVQDVFVRMQAAQSRQPIQNIERYMFVIARNVLVSQNRKRTARRFRLHSELKESRDYADEITPERIVIAKEEYERVMQSILDLPPRARAAFQFHRFDNLTYQEIADRMCISKESVKELMHRALVRIAMEMDTDE